MYKKYILFTISILILSGCFKDNNQKDFNNKDENLKIEKIQSNSLGDTELNSIIEKKQTNSGDISIVSEDKITGSGKIIKELEKSIKKQEINTGKVLNRDKNFKNGLLSFDVDVTLSNDLISKYNVFIEELLKIKNDKDSYKLIYEKNKDLLIELFKLDKLILVKSYKYNNEEYFLLSIHKNFQEQYYDRFTIIRKGDEWTFYYGDKGDDINIKLSILKDNSEISEELNDKIIELEKKINEIDIKDYSSGISKILDSYKKRNQIYNDNKNLILELFKLNKLKIVDTIKIDDNYINIIGVPDNGSMTLNEYIGSSGNIDSGCGNDVDYMKSNIYNCLSIIKNNKNEYSIKYSNLDISSLGEKNYEIINNKYLLERSRFGDGCGGFDNYRLFDKNLEISQKIYKGTTGCYLGSYNSDLYEKGEYFIEITNDNFIAYGKTKYSSELNRQKYEYKKFLLKDSKKISFDINKNLLNGDKFEFIIDGRKESINFTDIDKMNGLLDEGNLLYMKLEKNTDNTYKILGEFSNSYIYYDHKQRRFSKAEILSCVDNSNIYDSKWYNLNSVKLNSKSGNYDFFYNIDDKYGNVCKIPYKIRLYDTTDRSYFEAEFSVDF